MRILLVDMRIFCGGHKKISIDYENIYGGRWNISCSYKNISRDHENRSGGHEKISSGHEKYKL